MLQIVMLQKVTFASVLKKRYQYGDSCYWGCTSGDGNAPCYPNCGCQNSICTCSGGGLNANCTCQQRNFGGYGYGQLCYNGCDAVNRHAPCYPNCGCKSGSCWCDGSSICTCK